MKTIILDEDKKNILVSKLIEESIGYTGKVKQVLSYLNKNFIKGSRAIKNSKGKICPQKVAIRIDYNRQSTNELITIENVYYEIQEEFKNIITNKKMRNNFLWQLVNDWFNKKITKNGNLSNYYFNK